MASETPGGLVGRTVWVGEPKPRVGLVVPPGTLTDREYWLLAGDGADVFVTRTDGVEGGMVESRSRDMTHPSILLPAVRHLLAVDPDIVVFACTAASFVGGMGRERRIRASIEAAGAREALTTSGALLAILELLGVTRLAVATPYITHMTSRLAAFLAEAGVSVVSTVAQGLVDPAEVALLRPDVVRRMALAADTTDAEAVFLSCTNMFTTGLLEGLSDELGKPVLSSNQVTMAAALRAVGRGERADAVLGLAQA